MNLLFTRYAWLCALLLALTSWTPAQSDPIKSVQAAFANGSSRELSQYLAPTVEVGFDGDSHSYNATQAELVIKNFFAKNPPTSCEPLHNGSSTDGIPYVMYSYGSRSGTYRIFVRFKAKQSTPTIATMDITKQ